jgi:hypothetical protein
LLVALLLKLKTATLPVPDLARLIPVILARQRSQWPREEPAGADANGVKNGTLTPGQTSRLENREQNIENRQKADMAAHNGRLTKGEQKQLNREQNLTSKQIYKNKHDGE